MRKEISMFLTVMITLTTISGCNFSSSTDKTDPLDLKDTQEQSTPLSKDDNEKVKIRIGWEFKNDIKIENDMEVPYTDIFLILDSETDKKIKVGRYIGYAFEIEEFINRDLPFDTLLACQSWYAGGGDDLCVVYKENNTLSILWRPIYEPAGDSEDFELHEFQEINEINLPDNVIVELMPVSQKDKPFQNDEEVLEYNDALFKVVYELGNSKKIYYSDSRIILIKTVEEYKQLNDININDGFASFPVLSPNKKNIAYISPFEFELYGSVYIYNIEDELNGKVVQVDLDKSDTAKVVKWLDDDRLLVIIGFGTGTVSKGGDLYLYNKISNKTTLIKAVEGKKEIIDFKIAEDRVILEIITWDDDYREYVSEFEELTFETIYDSE